MTPDQMEHFKNFKFRGLTGVDRFWGHVDKTPGNGPKGECWLWLAYRTKDGYGQLAFGDLTTTAQRVSFELVHGPLGNNYVDCVLHECDNPPCVNPDHLFLGSRKDNIVDMTEKGRLASFKGQNNSRVVLSDAQVLEIFHSDDTNVDLGERYGIAPTTVAAIRNQRNWKHLTGHLPKRNRR